MMPFARKWLMSSRFLDPAANSRLRERWKRLFSRLDIEREEVNILRGILARIDEIAGGGRRS